MLFVDFLQQYKNCKSVGLSSVSQGVISFRRFSDGVFSKPQWGWGPLDGVSVKQMGFQ